MTAKFAFIDGEKDNFPITKMCGWLGVSTSGYYEWKDRAPSPTAQRRERLAAMITTTFHANHGTYGYRRIHAVLARSGEQVSDELVRDLMRELGPVACQPRPWRPTTTDPDDQHRIPDLVGRDFTAAEPGTKLVGGITYISTSEGWVYLATVIDCYSKMVIGWSMADHYKTSLIAAALDSAAGTIDLQPECIFHSDRGSKLHMVDPDRDHLRARRAQEPGVGGHRAAGRDPRSGLHRQPQPPRALPEPGTTPRRASTSLTTSGQSTAADPARESHRTATRTMRRAGRGLP